MCKEYIVSHSLCRMSGEKKKYICGSIYNVQSPTLQVYINIEYSSILLAPEMLKKQNKKQNK